MVKRYKYICQSILSRGGTATTVEIREDTGIPCDKIDKSCYRLIANGTMTKKLKTTKTGSVNYFTIMPSAIERIIRNLKKDGLILK